LLKVFFSIKGGVYCGHFSSKELLFVFCKIGVVSVSWWIDIDFICVVGRCLGV